MGGRGQGCVREGPLMANWLFPTVEALCVELRSKLKYHDFYSEGYYVPCNLRLEVTEFDWQLVKDDDGKEPPGRWSAFSLEKSSYSEMALKRIAELLLLQVKRGY
jgi:hypothetical protein